MKKVASEAAHIPLGMRQDIQAKYHHGRAPPGDWADMPDRDDYMVRGAVSDPNRSPSAGSEGYLAERANGSMHSFG